MANSAISASVRYLSDGASCAWPIPFPFGSSADIGVSITADGATRTLEYGKDYLISGNCVMAVVPAGAAIAIWLAIAPEAAISGAKARAMTDAAQASMQASVAAGPVYLANDAAIEPSVEETIADGLERLRQLSNERCAMLTQLLNTEAEKLRAQMAAAIETAKNSAIETVTLKADDEAASLKSRSAAGAANVYSLERAAISTLNEAGREYIDNMAQEARTAEASLAEARGIAAGIDASARALSELSGNAARLASDAQLDAAIAKDAAGRAWEAAWQASCMANRPGVGTIGKMAELDKCGSGMFVINGRVVHTPTMFFGLWPTCCPCCAGWDGFFVIAPQFPDDPKLPPYPQFGGDNGDNGDNPGNPASVGNGGWGGCIHHKGMFEDNGGEE